jgi:Putative prokaryotic signal transducing protein
MRPVLRTTDRSLVESCRLALESEDIAAVTIPEADGALPFFPITVAVLDDADYDQALDIVRRLQSTPSSAWTGTTLSPRLLRALLLVLLVILAVVCIDFLGP